MRSYIIFTLMVLTSLTAFYLEPKILLANKSDNLNLEKSIPQAFANWRVVDDTHAQIIEPEKAAVINYLYSQSLSRVYVNQKTGKSVMLSIAYGIEQSDGKEVHKPEVCYPAQGFSIERNSKIVLKIGDRQSLYASHLVATLGDRIEPVIYWTTLGTHTYHSRLQKKRLELEYALKNLIPDGLLFRVSTIVEKQSDTDVILNQFIDDLYTSIDEQAFKNRLFGSE